MSWYRLCWLALGLVLIECHPRLNTPEKFQAGLQTAVAQSDGLLFFRCLDLETRWSIESTFRDQKTMRTLILAKYPEAEMARALFSMPFADEPDAPHFFARWATENKLFDRDRQAPFANLPPKRSSDGNYGLDPWLGEWKVLQERAAHDLMTVRQNAALYRKVAQ